MCSTTAKHDPNTCTMAFGKPSKVVGACKRCDELRAGAAPVSWNIRSTKHVVKDYSYGLNTTSCKFDPSGRGKHNVGSGGNCLNFGCSAGYTD